MTKLADMASPRQPAVSGDGAVRVRIVEGSQLREHVQSVIAESRPAVHPDHDLRWLLALADGLGHRPYLLEAVRGPAVVGRLPLAFVGSLLFGRFLVSLPYLNSAGVQADDSRAAHALVDQAVSLADQLNCRFLEMRHESAVEHPAFSEQMTHKVHMRLPLPETAGALWDGFKAAVRNQIRKGQKQGFTVRLGSVELMDDFYAVFSQNMRDLGTPVYGRKLFTSILNHFEQRAELCVVHDGPRPIAAALLIHGQGVTEVPSASALRSYNPTNANMLMYWHLLERSVERGQAMFDFGRATVDSNMYRFKKQWGARPEPSVWQYYVRRGAIDAVRPENSRHQRMIRIWKRLPVWLTRLIGPSIIRGVP